MNPIATAANLAWFAGNLPGWFAYRRAVRRPRVAQSKVLREILSVNVDSAFGRRHGFGTISTYRQFAEKVPIRDYDQLVPWIDRIRMGESQVLTTEPVIRLATTGGSSGGRKLIPYTARLQAQFNRAVGPWIVDLFRSHPSVLLGPAYWSISPAFEFEEGESAVPIGFQNDSEYLGGVRRRLVDAVMAVPESVRRASTPQQWQDLTVEHLSRCRDLRLISIWHPSFLEPLLDRLPPFRQVWPRLAVVSCWTDGHAGAAAHALASRLPGVSIQPKGLIATEGIVSIPFAGGWPLAVRSHFFEFLDGDQVSLAHELTPGRSYEVVLTTAGGLYRYRLGDQVRVDRLIGRTPSIRFVGRAGSVVDHFGEKLTDAFVAQVIREVVPHEVWAMLAFDTPGYTLYLDSRPASDLACRLDQSLRRNPQYSYCRDLGQLPMPRLFQVSGDSSRQYTERMSRLQSLGDIKPAALSKLDDWTSSFEGRYRCL